MRFGGKRDLVVDLAEEYQTIQVEGADVVEKVGSRVFFQFERVRETVCAPAGDGNAISASNLIAHVSSKYRIRDLVVKEPDIEDKVRRIYEGMLSGM